MSQASPAERYMLKLINQARANAGLDPLHFNGRLNTAAEKHTEWMLRADKFSHDGAGGSDFIERIKDAGYRLTGNWAAGENIAWQSERGAAGLKDDARDLFHILMNSPGHRANILNPDYDEIGIGIVRGGFKSGGHVWDAAMVTQDFGRSAATNNRHAAPDHFILRSTAADHDLSPDPTPAALIPDLADLITALDAAAAQLRTTAAPDHFLFG